MTGRIPSETHSFSIEARKVVMNGMEFFHNHCRACGRDFLRTASTHHWHAAHIKVFSARLLSPETTEKWLSEPCPGERRVSDDLDRMLRKEIGGKRRGL